MKIITNNIPHPLVYGYELPEKARKEFDYIPEEEFDSHDFVKYKGRYYDVSQFMRIEDKGGELKDWDGYSSDSSFSGILIKVLPSSESVIIGRYFV